MEDNQALTWLHLSDLHVGMKDQDWLWPSLKTALYEDLKKVHASAGAWDLVIFSGDLTQKGSRNEFDKLDKILAELWGKFREWGFSPKLFVIPGNHDVHRPENPNAQLKVLKRWFEEPDIHVGFFSSKADSYRKSVNDLEPPPN